MSSTNAEAKIDLKTWHAILNRLPTGMEVKVGVLAGAGGERRTADGQLSMLELAAIHEFGTKIELGERSRISDRTSLGAATIVIKERSFIRSTFEREDVVEKLTKLCSRAAAAIVGGKLTAEAALGQVGAWAAAQVKNTIKARLTTGPEDQANAPSTIRKKGSSTPLVDTGRLLDAISWLVRKK